MIIPEIFKARSLARSAFDPLNNSLTVLTNKVFQRLK